MNKEQAYEYYRKNGHTTTEVLINSNGVADCIISMEDVLNGNYETGIDPKSVNWKPEDNPWMIKRIEQPHWCNKTIHKVISNPLIGEYAAKLTGAKMIQIWNVQLLEKPSGNRGNSSNVGWHQDYAYWNFWEGEVFTIWLAISDVEEDCGPIQYVTGSHEWGSVSGSDFWFNGSLDELKKNIDIPNGMDWEEYPAVLPAGAGTFHHKYTVHGSGKNTSGRPRRSFAIHLRTEKSKYLSRLDTKNAVTHLDDNFRCPIIYNK